jgi:hypothetical protein
MKESVLNNQEKNIYEKNLEQPIIVPNELANRTSLFFRLHVSGIIESANVKQFTKLVLRWGCNILQV